MRRQTMNMQEAQVKFESYLLTQKRVSDNTFGAYKRDLQQFVSYLKQEKITLSELQVPHLKSFLVHLNEQGISARSLARKISTLKAFFSYLNERMGFENLAAELHVPKIEKKLPQYLQESEIQKLFAAAHEGDTPQDIRNRVMLYLLYVSGMRVSEMVQLKTSHLQFDTGVVQVEGKGGKQRIIPLPHPILAMLKEYIAQTHPSLIYQKGAENKTDYLFPVRYSGKIKPISRQAFWVILNELCTKSGIPKSISPHKLRHSLATHMLKNGADLRSLQILLGHENVATVQIYTHLETSHLRMIYDKKHPRS